jgi:hypothetical protein
MVREHGHVFDHVLDDDASFSVVCGFPERLNVEVG